MSTIIIHGGAWKIPAQQTSPQKKSLLKALSVARKILESGGKALDAVEAAVVSMEDSGDFDAGTGAWPTEQGGAELDASIMGGDLSLGAVAAVTRIKNPILLARKVMATNRHCFLIGTGAEEFAVREGFKLTKPVPVAPLAGFHLEKGEENEFGTVGAVALDDFGNVAAATSTGGTLNKMTGRIGDSPIVGCGTYADNESGACSCTGLGEAFMKVVAAKTACDYLLMEKTAQAAAEKTIERVLERGKGKGGLILLGKNGDVGIAFSTPAMARGYWKAGMKEPVVEI